jgi:hypothetical protein
MTTLRIPIAPALPAPDDAYTTALNNTLRLYFNSLDANNSAINGTRGAQYLGAPYGEFYSVSTQTLAAVDTPQLVVFDTTGVTSGMYRVLGDGIHVEQEGVYNYIFSVQFANTDTTAHEAIVWLRKNGTDIANTASWFAVPPKHGTTPGYSVGACNFFMDLVAGDFIEMWWAAPSLSTLMQTYPAQTTPYARPGVPSVVITLTYVSRSGQ